MYSVWPKVGITCISTGEKKINDQKEGYQKQREENPLHPLGNSHPGCYCLSHESKNWKRRSQTKLQRIAISTWNGAKKRNQTNHDWNLNVLSHLTTHVVTQCVVSSSPWRSRSLVDGRNPSWLGPSPNQGCCVVRQWGHPLLWGWSANRS